MTDFDPAELARLADNATPCDWVAAESQGLAWQVFAQSVWGPFIVRDVERQRDAEFIAYCGTHRDAIVAALQPRTTPATENVTIQLPLAHWQQIVSDIENMCGCGRDEIEILADATVVTDET